MAILEMTSVVEMEIIFCTSFFGMVCRCGSVFVRRCIINFVVFFRGIENTAELLLEFDICLKNMRIFGKYFERRI